MPKLWESVPLEECEEDPIPMYDAEGNVYIIYYCPNCQSKIYEKSIKEVK